jgi:hypothetical protein
MLLLVSTAIRGQSISKYQIFTGWGTCHKAEEVIILRKFEKQNHSFYFAVSPETLASKIIRADSIIVNPATWPEIYTRCASSAYIKALQQVKSKGNSLQDAGLTQFSSSQKGIDLTIDLCPSHRPLDRIVFNDLIKELSKIQKPVPLAVSITGRWMNLHSTDLHWLDSLVRVGDLSITWINHTYNHNVAKNLPLNENFILQPGTDINSEVLNTEIAMLERNIVPSAFFRFPGLVSNQAAFDKILSFGLIPVGSDAWLAKGQWPTDGSIVLIHANGNEPVGVHDFIILLKNEQAAVLSKHWELFDLRESVIDDETK